MDPSGPSTLAASQVVEDTSLTQSTSATVMGDQLQQPGSGEATTVGLVPARKRCRSMVESADDENDDPAYFILFSSEDVVHAILSNGMATPYAGAVPPPVAGTGGNAATTSFRNLWQFVDQVAFRVGMNQANLVEDFDRRRQPGTFHGSTLQPSSRMS